MTTKYHTLQPWLPEILTTIKKEIKTEYLPKDPPFCRTHFGNRPLNRLTTEEINAAFIKELLQGTQETNEWVVNRWVFRHGDLYQHFADRLSVYSTDFDAIKTLTPEQSEAVLKGAVESFGAKAVYFFSVLNDVVFPESIFNRLRKMTEEAEKTAATEAAATAEKLELSKLVEKHEKELARLSDKYEQKLAGVLKKYTTDTEALKTQIRALQKRVNPA